MTPAQHLLAWFTPLRRQLINTSALDRHAQRKVGSFSRFLNGEKYVTFERAGVAAYYPVLQYLGYLPPPEYWVPPEHLTPEQNSSEIREWFQGVRRELLNLRQLDKLSGRPYGILSRYLNFEPNLTFKIVGIDVYYPMLELFGFVRPLPATLAVVPTEPAAQHLLTWFTPERRKLINPHGLDESAGRPTGMFVAFLAGHKHVQLSQADVEAYQAALALFGYRPDLDLSQDASVQRHQPLPASPQI